jgi:hypothetical protein
MTGDSLAKRVELRTEQARQAREQGQFAAASAHQRAANRLLGCPNEAGTLPELDDGSLMVFSAFNDPHGHRQRWGGLAVPVLHDDPLRDPVFTKAQFLTSEDKEIVGGAEDYSFFVMDDDSGQPILLVECDVVGERYLGCREAGVELTVIADGSPLLDKARALALRQLDLITAWAGCPYCALELSAEAPVPPSVIAHLGNPRDLPVILFRNGWIELNQEMAEIEKGYRASTRQRVRWGRENVRVVSFPDTDMDFPSVYCAIMAAAGRGGGWSPHRLAQVLEADHVRAYVAVKGECPAAIVLTSRHGLTTYDMATAKLPDDKSPLTHILIHTAIADAKARGQNRFSFGPLYDGGEFGAKLKSISEFKAGFASSYERLLRIKMMG